MWRFCEHRLYMLAQGPTEPYATAAQLPLAAPLAGGTRGDIQPHLLATGQVGSGMVIRDLLTAPHVAQETRNALPTRLEAPPVSTPKFLIAAGFRCCQVRRCG